MKKYGEYKGADIPWIDSVPSHWQINNIWQLLFEVKCKNTGMQENNLLSLSYGKVVRRNINATEGLLPENFEGYNIIEANDIVLRLTDLQNDHKSLRTGLCCERGIITSAYLTLRANNQDNAQYIQLLLHTYDIYKVFYNIGASGVRQSLNWDTFKTLKVLLPPRSEQDHIVRYLDYKTARIDKLISGYKRQIELLEERKRKVEDNAIVNGIQSDVAFKETKAEWMGKVPEHWREMRTKNFFAEINIRSENGDEPHLTMSQKFGLVTDDEYTQKRLLSEDYKGAKLCWKDDIVLNRLKAHLGVFALSPILGVVSPDYIVIRIDKQYVLPEYALKLFRCQSFRSELTTRVRGIVEGFWRLYTEDLGAIRVCIPPIEEQKQILDSVKSKEEKINQAITGINKQIALLQEYRTRLISDVVTGQVDVRDEVIPETEVNDIGN